MINSRYKANRTWNLRIYYGVTLNEQDLKLFEQFRIKKQNEYNEIQIIEELIDQSYVNRIKNYEMHNRLICNK